MHILIGIAALVALLLLIRTLYYATLLMRPQVDLLKAERRAERQLYAQVREVKRNEQRRYGFWEPGPMAAIVAICIILLATFGPLLVIAGH
jgi:hypothetical protein